MPSRLTLGPLPVLRGARVLLRERREPDIDDRLRYPIDPGEEDNCGSSWRRDWDGRRAAGETRRPGDPEVAASTGGTGPPASAGWPWA